MAYGNFEGSAVVKVPLLMGMLMLGSVLVLGLPASPVHASDRVSGPELTWDVSLWGKRRAMTEGVERLSALVHEKTGGNWQVRLHYGEALSKARENLDGLAVGAFEAAMFCNFYHPKKNPALMVLTMPFLPMSDWADNRKVREAVYSDPAVARELARWNAMLYVSSYLPQYEFIGKGRLPLELADWKGLTVRAGGGIGQAMKVLGATPTSSAASEVYIGVQQGTMNAAAIPYTYSHVAYRIHEVSEWFTSNLSPGTSDCPLALSIHAYEKLPPQYKQLLDDIKEPVIQTQIQAYIDMDRVNLPLLKASLTEIRYTQEQLDAFQSKAGRPVIEAWIRDNQGRFDARGLVETVFESVGQVYR